MFIIHTHHPRQLAQRKGFALARVTSAKSAAPAQTVPAAQPTNPVVQHTHLRVQGRARKSLHPCTLGASHLSPRPAQGVRITTHQKAPRHNAKPLALKPFNPQLSSHNPMKHRQFQHLLPSSLNGRAIPTILCRLNATPPTATYGASPCVPGKSPHLPDKNEFNHIQITSPVPFPTPCP